MPETLVPGDTGLGLGWDQRLFMISFRRDLTSEKRDGESELGRGEGCLEDLGQQPRGLGYVEFSV